MSREWTILALSIAIGAAGFEAQAHAHLTAADPPVNGSVRAPKAIRITFSEALAPKFSRFEVLDSLGHKVAMSAPAVDPADKRVLTASTSTPLTPGRYTVRWRAVAADTHAMSGQYRFSVIR